MHALIPLCIFVSAQYILFHHYLLSAVRSRSKASVTSFILIFHVYYQVLSIHSLLFYHLIVCPAIIFWIDHHMRHLHIFSCILFYNLVYYCYSTPICKSDVSSTRSIANGSHFQYSNLYTYIRNYFGAHLISLPVLIYL